MQHTFWLYPYSENQFSDLYHLIDIFELSDSNRFISLFLFSGWSPMCDPVSPLVPRGSRDRRKTNDQTRQVFQRSLCSHDQQCPPQRPRSLLLCHRQRCGRERMLGLLVHPEQRPPNPPSSRSSQDSHYHEFHRLGHCEVADHYTPSQLTHSGRDYGWILL